MLATKGGHTKTVKALIEAGADVALKNYVYSYEILTRCLVAQYYSK